jgi:hypothetical protein
MSTISAFIFIGSADQNHSGIIPTHYVMLSEDDHPSLSLHRIGNNIEIIRIRPAVEKLVDNIYLLIYTFVLKSEVFITTGMDGKEIHKLYNREKENLTYEQLMSCLETCDLKVVFNILAGSSLLGQLDRIKAYPNDFEVTTAKFRKEYSYKTGKVEYDEF